MHVCVVYGSERRESTYHVVKYFLEELAPKQVEEFFLPKDFPHFCKGCGVCIMKGEQYCGHRKELLPILESMEKADLLIFATPVYVMRTSGQMKALLDHFAYQFMVHRPRESMFSKKALIVSTAAGGGMKSAIKDIQESLNFWGVGKIYTYGKAVNAISWQGVPEKKKEEIKRAAENLGQKILRYQGKKPSFRVRMLFFIMKNMQKKFRFNEEDVTYWEQKGWFSGKKPWKNLDNLPFVKKSDKGF